MVVVVNLEKDANAKLGIFLKFNHLGRVFIYDIIDYPSPCVRERLQVGDILRSVNGKPCTSVRDTATRIIRAGPHVSLCIDRLCDGPL